jgi:hypothetical protein
MCRLRTEGWTIEQIPQLDRETGTRARSALVGYTLCFANIPEISLKNRSLITFSKRPGEIFGLS